MYSQSTRSDAAKKPLLLSIKQAAETLNLSERTVWTLVQAGEMPHLRIGRRLLFSQSALEAWIRRHERGGDPNLGNTV